MYEKKLIITTFILLGVTGCSLKQAPLIYSSKTTLGIDLSTAVVETGATFSFGFKNQDMLYIPAIVSYEDSNNTRVDQNSTLSKVESSDNNKTDTLSVYATFSNNFSSASERNITLDMGVNKFVSTGIAAQNLSKNIFMSRCIGYAKDKNTTNMVKILQECKSLLELR